MPGRFAARRSLLQGSPLWILLSSAAWAPWAHGAQARPAPPASKELRANQDANRFTRELTRRVKLLRSHPGRAPQGVLAVLGASSLLDGELDASALPRWLQSLADDRTRHPLVRSYAAQQRAALAQGQGERAQAREQLAAQGYLIDWQVVGPFDNSGRKGEDAAYAPEQEPYRDQQTFEGVLAGEPLVWRAVEYDAVPRAGYVSLDDLLRPNEDVTGYATCWVHVAKATEAALHLGTAGPFRAFVDGAEVGRGRAYRPAHPLQETFPVNLQAGWNRVLVKISALDRSWGFYARLSSPSGAPLPDLQVVAAAPQGWSDKSADRPAAQHRVASLRGELERRAHAGSSAAEVDLLEFYRYVQPFDFDDDASVTLARAVEDRVGSARSAWLHAIVESDPNEAFAALRRGITRAQEEGERSRDLLSQMLLELAWRNASVGLHDRYRQHLDEAEHVTPGDPVVELEQIERLEQSGLDTLAFRRLEALAHAFPNSGSVHGALASRLRQRGRGEEALELLEALDHRGGTASHVGQRIELLLELGRPREAVALAHALVAASPGLPQAHATVARLEEARGNLEAAVGAWMQAITLVPHDADQHAALGRMLARHGEREAAAGRLRRSLELRPQQPELRDLLATLEPKTQDDLFRRFAAPLEPIASTPTPAAWKGKSAGILRHGVAVRVLANGLTERLDQRIVRILDDRGVRSESVQAMAYDPTQSIVEVRRARVRRSDGTLEELGAVHEASLTSAGYRMYYDQRQVQVLFDGLRVGDTLEVVFVQRDIAAQNMFDEYFGDMMPLQGAEPRLHVEYVLEAPANKPIYFNLPGVARSTEGSKTTYRYEARDVAAIKPEHGMPGWTEIASFLHASTYRTWDEVGTWYWGLVAEQLVVDEDIRAAVREALRALPPNASEREKVDAIYTYVVRNTRYVGLEFGIHGFKPYRTTEVLSRRFGDCKDKASLLKVMLREAGIASNLVLVRTRDQGRVEPSPASLAIFNHAITYVPSLDLFLDGTAEWSGPSELPTGDQGATVLVVRDGQGGELRTIPVAPADANVRVTQQEITLQRTGAARVQHRFVVEGASASAMRHGFQTQEQRDERLAAAFGEVYPGVTVTAPLAPAIGDILKPAVIEATLNVPKWSTAHAAGLRFRVLGRESTLTASLAPQAKRTHELVLDVPSVERYDLHYKLPAGHRFTKLPASATLRSSVGSFALQVEATPEGARVQSEVRLDAYRVSAEHYPEFRDFLRQVDAYLDQSFELAPDR